MKRKLYALMLTATMAFSTVISGGTVFAEAPNNTFQVKNLNNVKINVSESVNPKDVTSTTINSLIESNPGASEITILSINHAQPDTIMSMYASSGAWYQKYKNIQTTKQTQRWNVTLRDFSAFTVPRGGKYWLENTINYSASVEISGEGSLFESIGISGTATGSYERTRSEGAEYSGPAINDPWSYTDYRVQIKGNRGVYSQSRDVYDYYGKGLEVFVETETNSGSWTQPLSIINYSVNKNH